MLSQKKTSSLILKLLLLFAITIKVSAKYFIIQTHNKKEPEVPITSNGKMIPEYIKNEEMMVNKDYENDDDYDDWDFWFGSYFRCPLFSKVPCKRRKG